MMTTKIEEKENRLIAFFAGRLDTAAAVQTTEDVKPLLQVSDKEIVLDCTDLAYISSSGLRIFLPSVKRRPQRETGSLCAISMPISGKCL